MMTAPSPGADEKPTLEADGSFVVKEFTSLNAIAAAIFWALFLFGLLNTPLFSEEETGIYDKMLLVALVPALVFTSKALSKRVYIRIDEEGITINNFFLTNWKNFISAENTQEPVAGNFQDNFVLIINYYREGLGHYVKKTALTNTQDKAEEEVIAAIHYFYDLSLDD